MITIDQLFDFMHPGDVVDHRTVALLDGGKKRAEWRLVVTEDHHTRWEPAVVDVMSGELLEKPGWMPLPGSQQVFLSCPIYEVLLHGNRGPGKTLTLLMDFTKEVGRGFGGAWRGVMFRRQYKDLDDVVRKIDEWFYKLFPGFQFKRAKSDYQAIWPTGESLLLRQGEDVDDYESFHGHELPWIGWEELTQHENHDLYLKMMSCSRPPAPGIPTRVRSTTNPFGEGHGWVKRRFQLPQMDGKVIRSEEDMPRVAIRGVLSENFPLLHSDKDYPKKIRQAARNKEEARAWLLGDWNVTAGGIIDDVWNHRVHVLPAFPAGLVPRGWTLTRAYDHGQSSPFSVGWFWESDGTALEWMGRRFGQVRGDLVLWAEWYGTSGNENEGLRMAARDIAQGILDREDDMGVRGRVRTGPADTEIWTKDNRGLGRSPSDDMESAGVFWDKADKSSGSRRRGVTLLRGLLLGAFPNDDGTREVPGFFVCDSCKYWLDHVPSLPRDKKNPDDIPQGVEDHDFDMTRYRVNWVLPGMSRRSF